MAISLFFMLLFLNKAQYFQHVRKDLKNRLQSINVVNYVRFTYKPNWDRKCKNGDRKY